MEEVIVGYRNLIKLEIFFGEKHWVEVVEMMDDQLFKQLMVPALAFRDLEISAKKPFPNKYPKELKTVGNHIRKARLDRKLTHKGLAAILKVRFTTVIAWELNQAIPRLENISSVIRFLGYDPFPKQSE